MTAQLFLQLLHLLRKSLVIHMIPHCHQNGSRPADPFRLPPLLKIEQGVCAYNEIKLRIRMLCPHLLQGPVGVGIILRVHLIQTQLKMTVSGDGSSHHLHPFQIRGPALSVPLMGRIARGQKQHLVQRKLFVSSFRQDQMADMNGIKGSSHDTDLLLFLLHPRIPPYGSTIFFLSFLPSL